MISRDATLRRCRSLGLAVAALAVVVGCSTATPAGSSSPQVVDRTVAVTATKTAVKTVTTSAKAQALVKAPAARTVTATKTVPATVRSTKTVERRSTTTKTVTRQAATVTVTVDQPSTVAQGFVDTGATNVYYANCTAARAAGAAPIYRGEPGYRSALDRDDDGIACE
jgi:cell envelope opacity-associated protein A